MPEDKKKDKIQQTIEDAEARAAVRTMANAEEDTALRSTQQSELEGLQAYNTAQYENVGQIVGDIQSKIGTATAKDALARKREDAYRNISGLGDTLSSLANLVGTAHSAANQQQSYNSNAVVQKAEEARKARKLEMDDLNKRLDEMKNQQRELKAAGSLAEAQLKAKQAREFLELQSKQRQNEETARQYDAAQIHQAERDARTDYVTDRSATQTQENWQKNYDMQYAKFKAEAAKDNYPIVLQDGTYIDIPKRNLNELNIGDIFNLLPPEVRKNVKGKPYTVKKGVGVNATEETAYNDATLEQKLAALVAYSSDPSSPHYDIDKATKIREKIVGLASAKPFKEKNEDGTINIPNW